jgi:hypothetical protein
MGLAGFAVPPGFLHHHGAAALGPRFASLAASVVGANSRQHEPGAAADLGAGGVLRRRALQISDDGASEGTPPKKGKVTSALHCRRQHRDARLSRDLQSNSNCWFPEETTVSFITASKRPLFLSSETQRVSATLVVEQSFHEIAFPISLQSFHTTMLPDLKYA